MIDISKLKEQNEIRWKNAKINENLVNAVGVVAARLTSDVAMTRYKAVESVTHVPWYIIAVIHEREASQSWHSQLAQGDPLGAVSRHVPAGRGPFKTWEAAAYDALVNCAPHAARWTDWSPGGALTLLEEYNGLGYAGRNIPSPYVWASTDQYLTGKFISDHHFDAWAIDHQLGCAALLKHMQIEHKDIFSVEKQAV